MNGQMSLASLPRLLRDDAGLTQAFGNPAALVAVPESARAVTIAALAQLGDRHPLLVATPTGSDAGQLYDDLCQFMPADSVVLFPAWETLPFERISPSVETMGRRMDVLWRLRDEQQVSNPRSSSPGCERCCSGWAGRRSMSSRSTSVQTSRRSRRLARHADRIRVPPGGLGGAPR